MPPPPRGASLAPDARTLRRQRRQQFAQRLRRLLSLVWQLSPTSLVLQIVFELIGSAETIAQLYVAKRIIDSIVAAVRTPGHPTGEVRLWILVEFGLFLSGMLVNNVGRTLQTRLAQESELRLRRRVLEHCSQLRYARFEDPEFITRLTIVRQTSVSSIVAQMLNTIRQTITLFGSVSLLASKGIGVFASILAAAIPPFVLELRQSRHTIETQRAQIDWGRRATYLESLLLSDQSVREVKALGLADWLLQQYLTLTRSTLDRSRVITQSRQLRSIVMQLYVQTVYVIAYLETALRAASGALTVGEMTVSLSVFKSSQGSIGALMAGFSTIYRTVLNLEPLFAFFDEPTEDGEIVGEGLELPAAPHGSTIEFRNVSFAYPQSDRAVLSNISITIKAGETVALVGRNGSGKTTLVKLLLGLYRPTSGKIFIDGVDTSQVSVRKLRERVAVIFQDFARLQMSASENIGVGWLPDLENDEAIQRAVDHAGANEIVSLLPGGMQAQLGKMFRGTDLSGGQWQRLALARAALRPSGLLVLDEPTAALDAEAEVEVFRRMIDVKTNRTTLLITHRFSTIHMADRIIVLDQGRIAEDGTHAALIEQNGRYASMYLAQAKGFLDLARPSLIHEEPQKGPQS